MRAKSHVGGFLLFVIIILPIDTFTLRLYPQKLGRNANVGPVMDRGLEQQKLRHHNHASQDRSENQARGPQITSSQRIKTRVSLRSKRGRASALSPRRAKGLKWRKSGAKREGVSKMHRFL